MRNNANNGYVYHCCTVVPQLLTILTMAVQKHASVFGDPGAHTSAAAGRSAPATAYVSSDGIRLLVENRVVGARRPEALMHSGVIGSGLRRRRIGDAPLSVGL